MAQSFRVGTKARKSMSFLPRCSLSSLWQRKMKKAGFTKQGRIFTDTKLTFRLLSQQVDQIHTLSESETEIKNQIIILKRCLEPSLYCSVRCINPHWLYILYYNC